MLISSLIKSIKILCNSKKAVDKKNYNKNNNNINDELFNKIIKFIFLMIENDSDNCMLLMISDIILTYESINISQGEKFIDLYYY